MSKKVRHRGPDWSGIYSDRNAILAHERLAIVDPISGKQPLINKEENLIPVSYTHLTLPTIIKKIGKSAKAEIPFYTTWIKKDGTVVNSSVNFEIDISTMITTINAHFED